MNCSNFRSGQKVTLRTEHTRRPIARAVPVGSVYHDGSAMILKVPNGVWVVRYNDRSKKFELGDQPILVEVNA